MDEGEIDKRIFNSEIVQSKQSSAAGYADQKTKISHSSSAHWLVPTCNFDDG